MISKICRMHRISKVDIKYRRDKMSRMGKVNKINKMDKSRIS